MRGYALIVALIVCGAAGCESASRCAWKQARMWPRSSSSSDSTFRWRTRRACSVSRVNLPRGRGFTTLPEGEPIVIALGLRDRRGRRTHLRDGRRSESAVDRHRGKLRAAGHARHRLGRCEPDHLCERQQLRRQRGGVDRRGWGESPRVSRRLHCLRGWSHGKEEQVPGRGA